MGGLKRVRNRREDGLSAVRWDRLETLLAECYAAQGYHVEHVGTGGTASRFDGGIDLKLRREDEYVLVQCKGWNVYQVPHNEVHQLIGLMVNEGATGAILATSGEFTRAAIDAAAKGRHVQLVDGDALRQMLGPFLAPDDLLQRNADPSSADGIHTGRAEARPAGHEVGQGRVRRGHRTRTTTRLGAVGLGRRLAFALLSTAIFLVALFLAQSLLRSGLASLIPSGSESDTAGPPSVTNDVVQPSHDGFPSDTDAAPRPQTDDEIRESQRKAEEAMKVIEATTPEV